MLRRKLRSSGMFRQKQCAGVFPCRHSALCEKYTNVRLREKESATRYKRGRTKARSTGLVCTAYRLQEECGRHSPACQIQVSRGKREVQRQLLVLLLIPPKPHVETMPLCLQRRDAEKKMVDAAEKESPECSGDFDVAYVRQGDGAAQHCLVLLQPV